jgi:hypothetical protein
MPSQLPIVRNITRRDGRRVVDLSESSNLYLTAQQGRWFERVVHDELYSKEVVDPLSRAAGVVPSLCFAMTKGQLDSGISLINCGPATAKESVDRLRSMMKLGRVVEYVIVDMNSRLLQNALDGLRDAGVEVRAVCGRFEALGRGDFGKLCRGQPMLLFGSTCMNYEPSELRPLLARMVDPGTFVAMETLVRKASIQDAGAYMSRSVRRFVFGPLWLAGGDPGQFEFVSAESRDRIRLGFEARTKVALRHPDIGELHPNDLVWTAFSRRPSALEHLRDSRMLSNEVSVAFIGDHVAATVFRI